MKTVSPLKTAAVEKAFLLVELCSIRALLEAAVGF